MIPSVPPNSTGPSCRSDMAILGAAEFPPVSRHKLKLLNAVRMRRWSCKGIHERNLWVWSRDLVLRSRSLCTRTLDSEGALHTRCLVDADVWSRPHRPRDFRCHAHAFMNIISAVPFFTGDPSNLPKRLPA